jgi:uncharacterized membrane protein
MLKILFIIGFALILLGIISLISRDFIPKEQRELRSKLLDLSGYCVIGDAIWCVIILIVFIFVCL